MALEDSPRAPAKLAFGKAYGTAHDHVFRRVGRFAKMAAVPTVLALALAVVEIPLVAALPVTELAFLVLDLLPYALLGIALSRVVLLGEAPAFLPPQPLGRRTWIFLGYSLLIIIVSLIPVAALFIAVVGVNYSTPSGTGTLGGLGIDFGFAGPVLIGLTGALIMFYLLARFSLIFPAVSLDQKLGIAGSWRLTRGNGWRLTGFILAVLAFTLLAALVGAVILGGNISINIGGSIEVPPGVSAVDVLLAEAPALIWSTLVSIVGFGLATAAFASAYAQLGQWGTARQEILERFE